MYKMNDGWTEERMDDFRDEVYRRFDKVEDDVNRRFDEVDKRIDKLGDRFEGLDDRFAALQRTLLVTNGAIIAGLIGVIATQL